MKFFSFTGTWNGYVWKRYILLLQIDPLFLSFDSAKLTYFTNDWFHWAFCTNGAYNFTHFFLKIILLIWKEEKGNHHCESKQVLWIFSPFINCWVLLIPPMFLWIFWVAFQTSSTNTRNPVWLSSFRSRAPIKFFS